MNTLSTIKSSGSVKKADKTRPMMLPARKNAVAAETTALKLNELAKKRPFCCYLKNRKHDPL